MERLLTAVLKRIVWKISGGDRYFTHHLLGSTNAQQALYANAGHASSKTKYVNHKAVIFTVTPPTTSSTIALMMDVTEHVADDPAFIRSPAGLRRPRTHFLLSISAFSFLWSYHDAYLSHYRHHRLRQLESTVATASLDAARVVTITDRFCQQSRMYDS